MTCDEILCSEVHKASQQITGMGEKIAPDLILNALLKLIKELIQLVQQEKQLALDGKSARIIAKVNALTDPVIIRELYWASQAGVKIDLIERNLQHGIEIVYRIQRKSAQTEFLKSLNRI
jgi:polyphosphate kinase